MSMISVIVPVYKVEPYINRCIDSILSQTFSDFELILVDDGSPDNCGAICDEYAAKDNRIRVLHQENRGQAVARNRALDIAGGTYIAFVDSDDWIHPCYLETLLHNLRSCDARISICGHITVGSTAEVPAATPSNPNCWDGKEYVRQCMTGQITNKAWILWDKLFHRDCFASIRMPEGRINEDNAIVYKILYEAECIVETDEVLYYYFQNEISTVNQPFRRKHLDWLLVPEEMIQYFTSCGDTVMVDKSNRMYLSALEDMYRKVCEYLDDPVLEAELLRRLRKQYVHEKRRYPVTIRTHTGLFQILFPRYSWCYWTLQGVCRKFFRRR